jgi:hypothetical protein
MQPASQVSRGLLVLLVVALSTSCSVRVPDSLPDALPDVPTITRQVECIELTAPGLSDDSINNSLVELAVADAKRKGRSIRLYKVVADSTARYYVFWIGGWSDVYTVYQTDPEGSKFIGKYQYGSLHYPCSAAGSSPPSTQQSPRPGSPINQ